jgi:hypothetical protein
MATIMALSTIAVYQFVKHSLYEELDRQLNTLANAAAHSLPSIKTNLAAMSQRLPKQIDNDGDLDIPWQDLEETQQGIEWFDREGHRLGKVGEVTSTAPLAKKFQIAQIQRIRILTLPIYLPTPSEPDETDHSRALQGYVRVSTQTHELQEDLERILAGLEVGGTIAVFLIGGTSWWLTRRSLQPIEQSFQKLQQFTADASHELRNPLTAIKTAIEVIQSHPERIHPSDEKKIAAIASATSQMAYLVNDLLLLARADANSTHPVVAGIPIPIDEILEDLLESLEPQAQAKGIQLQAKWRGEALVKGDAAQLRRVFSNLLDNALQYTPRGGTVQVMITHYESSVVVAIEDSGIGIALEHLPYIFDRFWRADQARSYREGGSGLGLAITQAIVQAHGGDISVTSQMNVGSCFQVRLPNFYR